MPQEASENLKAPELAPRDKRFNGRTKKIGFTCYPEFYQELRKLAFEENCKQIEILEKALAEYQKQKSSGKCPQCRKLIPRGESERCDKCGKKFCADCLTYCGANSELVFCRDCEKE